MSAPDESTSDWLRRQMATKTVAELHTLLMTRGGSGFTHQYRRERDGAYSHAVWIWFDGAGSCDYYGLGSTFHNAAIDALARCMAAQGVEALK